MKKINMHIHTFSIVALDEKHKKIGAAVQSHWFNVGALCPWVLPGVGAVATQAMVAIGYGPSGLALLEKGISPRMALKNLLEKDNRREVRQIGMINMNGETAVHTGKHCIAYAGHQTGTNYAVQGNMMENESVWSAMGSAFESFEGDFASRLVYALGAGQSAGGDVRGMQSAAIKIVDNIKDETPWNHVQIDLRVEDHEQPIQELSRLVNIHKAYQLSNKGDQKLAENDHAAALKAYTHAAHLAPNIEELRYWQAISLIDCGRTEEALQIFKEVFSINPAWVELTKRLPSAGFLPEDPTILKKILSSHKTI